MQRIADGLWRWNARRPRPLAFVPGDRLLGTGGGRLRLCPSGIRLSELREHLRPFMAEALA